MVAPRITLLTDFGTEDGYVAAMRGAIASHCPAVSVDDASHAIPPGDVHAAAHALSRYWRFFPTGTIHVVVVDPGVGSTRRALVVTAQDRLAVGPDNGVLDPMLAHASAVRTITNSSLLASEVSATFHGRDVFAPVAAFLACGGNIESVGEVVTDAVRLPVPFPDRRDDRVIGTVVHVDRFGNLITNLFPEDVRDREVRIDGRTIGPLRRTYSDVAPGEALALVGSSGMVEVSVRDGNAAASLGAKRGTTVEIV